MCKQIRESVRSDFVYMPILREIRILKIKK
ncbi:Uncharacterised protein [Staphylococcus xylosus]|nr:Uncharacterised protein [Staphylococcus xylosus]